MNTWLTPDDNPTKITFEKITVIGDIMLDRYWFGDAKRISPEAPVPVVNINQQEDRLGGAANVALNLRSLDIPTTLVGIIGTDNEAKILHQLCVASGIQSSLTADASRPTISKLRIIGRHQHILRCDFEAIKNSDIEILTELRQNSFKAIDAANVLLLSDYGKGTLCDIATLIAYAKSQNKPILVDPKGHSFEKYRGATIITPNRSEFEAVVGICETEAQLLERGESLRQHLELDAILITRSEQGMTLIEANQSPITFQAQARDVFDVTGAGDTVVAILAAGIAKGLSLANAAHIANVGASIVVGKLGASSVTEQELMNALAFESDSAQLHQRAHHLVLSKEMLKAAMTQARLKGETIVMTNGCFDLLHRGHVTYLEQARRLGNRLVVALNSDASVTRLKGAPRPIMDELSRSAVLASLSSVDWVVIFESDTPQELIEYLLPDVLVKGGDYSIDEIAGAEAVIKNGGQVQIIDLIEGYSTSNAVNKIKM